MMLMCTGRKKAVIREARTFTIKDAETKMNMIEKQRSV